MIGINVLLNTEIAHAILGDLGTHGRVRDRSTRSTPCPRKLRPAN